MKAKLLIPLAVIGLTFALVGCSGASIGGFRAPPEPISTPTPTPSPSPSPAPDDHRRELGAESGDSRAVSQKNNSSDSSL